MINCDLDSIRGLYQCINLIAESGTFFAPRRSARAPPGTSQHYPYGKRLRIDLLSAWSSDPNFLVGFRLCNGLMMFDGHDGLHSVIHLSKGLCEEVPCSNGRKPAWDSNVKNMCRRHISHHITYPMLRYTQSKHLTRFLFERLWCPVLHSWKPAKVKAHCLGPLHWGKRPQNACDIYIYIIYIIIYIFWYIYIYIYVDIYIYIYLFSNYLQSKPSNNSPKQPCLGSDAWTVAPFGSPSSSAFATLNQQRGPRRNNK